MSLNIIKSNAFNLAIDETDLQSGTTPLISFPGFLLFFFLVYASLVYPIEVNGRWVLKARRTEISDSSKRRFIERGSFVKVASRKSASCVKVALPKLAPHVKVVSRKFASGKTKRVKSNLSCE